MNKVYTLAFDQIDKKDLPLVGGKGANLGEMTKAGFNVPFGFCITTASYKEFLQYNQLFDFIAQTVRAANLDNIKLIGEAIRERISGAKMPEHIEQEIISAVNKIGADSCYAVRSSATAEDLTFASFAGQQDTYLNIKGASSILEAVINCWASLFTDRAIIYRIQNNIEHDRVLMSVVIQRMVLPEVSGIMFTADPVSGHRGIISIDAGYGLGEALVSGLVSPDIYRFRKADLQIESRTVAEKKLAILPMEGGGTKKVELNGEKSTSQVLSDSEIKALAELGMKIEKHYGCPQDIEWCMEKGQLYIVQSRAITSLFPLPAPLPKDDALHAYVSFNHIQVMTAPISPLGIDMLRILTSFDKGARSTEEYKVVKAAGGRVFVDISFLLQYKKLGRGFAKFTTLADALISEALQELISRPDFEVRIKKDKNSGKNFRKFMLPVALNAAKNIIYRNPEGTIDFINAYISRRLEGTANQINAAKHGVEKLEAIYKAAPFSEDFKLLLPKLAPGIIGYKGLEALEKKLLGSDKYANLIVKGLEGNITTEMGLLVGDLADLVRTSPDLIKEMENEDYLTLYKRINALEGHKEFNNKFNSFMDIYDMRAAGEIDMATDRWIENPEPLVKAIMATVETSMEGIHRKEYKETIEKAKIAAAELIKEVEAKHGKLKSKIVKRLIRVVRNHLCAREHPKYLIMKIILLCKRAFLEEAKLLVEKGHLREEKDIFYVGFWELYDALQHDKSLIELVQHRKEEYQHFKKLSAPRVITSDGEIIKAGYKRDNLPEGALPGMPVSSGVIEGIAKVVTDPSKAAVSKGEILVAPFTDPGWTPLFINAAGLVMEVGGMLTHGTVVAREYGIPAVVGITDATKKIRTGDRIRVDGNAGFVVVLHEQAQ